METPWYLREWAYGWLTLLVAIGGLIGLFCYVKLTRKIALETQRQGDILSRPAVSASLEAVAADRQTEKRMAHIGVLIRNHTNVHANVRIRLAAHLKNVETGAERVYAVGWPYNGDTWPFFAKQPFYGHFTISELVSMRLAENEELWLVGQMETSPYDVNDFRIGPPILYRWKDSDSRWVVQVPKT